MLRLRVFFARHKLVWLLSILLVGTLAWAGSMERSLRKMLAFAHNPVQIPTWGEFRPHPTYFWQLRPNLRGTMLRATRACSDPLPRDTERFYVSTNSWGMRGAEVTRAKPARAVRVLCVGDDVTFGYGVDNNSTYESILQSGFAQLSNGRQLQILNAGCPGWSSYQGKEWTRLIGRSFAPDIYIVGFSYADTSYEDKADSERVSSFALWQQLQIALFRSELYMYLHQQNTLAINPYGLPSVDYQRNKLRVPLEEYRANLTWFSSIAKEDGAHVLFLNFPYAENSAEVCEEYRFAVKDIAQSTGSLYSDMRILSSAHRAKFGATVYPTQAEYKQIAVSIMAELLKSGWLK